VRRYGPGPDRRLEKLLGREFFNKLLKLELPGQVNPWLLKSREGEVMTYLNLGLEVDGESNMHVVADVSRRFHNVTTVVVALLNRLKLRVGGVIATDA
jgi:hypothetical protein